MSSNRNKVTYDAILFDLDGTLTDPKVGITKGIQYALSKFNIIEDNLDKFIPFIGPPLKMSFQKYYSLDEITAQKAVEFYRDYQWDKGMYENCVYAGIPQMLATLKNSGKNLIIATSKLTSLAEDILKHFNLYDYFTMIVGSNSDSTRVLKADIISYILSEQPELKSQNVVMVGDREYDIIGAQNNRIDSVGVTYGYGSIEELKNENPTYIVNSVAELGELLTD